MSLHVYRSLFSLGRKHEPDENKRAKEGCGLNDAFTSALVTCLYRDPMGHIWYKVITEILCLKRGVKGDPNMPYTLAYSVIMMIQKIC
jgi:hypothetical protein